MSKRKAAALAEESTSSNKKNASNTSKLWEEEETMIIFCDKSKKESSSKIIGLDIDDTVIKTKSGKTFSTGPNDWLFWDEEVPKKLKEMNLKGYRIVFFSNQSGISKGKVTKKDFQNKLSQVIEEIGIPITILAATGSDKFRKPSIGMWKYFEESLNGGVNIDIKESYYIGDAAGRPKEWAPKKKKRFFR